MKNLTKANKIIEDIAKKDKNITPVTLKDLPLFQKFFKKEPHTYGNSWTYVMQGKYGIGPQGLGYKYYDGKNLSSFSIYPHMERLDTICIYWTRPMGEDILNIIGTYANKLLKSYKTPTYVKKIFTDQFNHLQKKGFKDTSKFPWHKSCSLEDDTYPEVIIDVEATVENKLHNETIRNILKRYRKIITQINVTKILSDRDRDNGWSVIKQFFDQDLITLYYNISTSEDYYNPLYFSIYKEHELFLINEEENKPKGIFDLHKLNSEYYAGYIALMLREKLHNLNEFSIVYRCKQIIKKGGKYLNLGGSETEGLHKFKSKFKVSRINNMYWAAFY